MGNCCRPQNKPEELEIGRTLSQTNNIDDSNLIFQSKYIRKDEYNKIDFTEEELLNLIN